MQTTSNALGWRDFESRGESEGRLTIFPLIAVDGESAAQGHDLRVCLDQPQCGEPANDFSRPPNPSLAGQFFESIAAVSCLAFFASLVCSLLLGRSRGS